MSPGQEIGASRIEPLWFLGTFMRIKLDAEQTDGRFALIEGVAPRGASPPLHSHPQDETFYLLDGELIAWVLGEDDLAAADREDPPSWVARRAQRCGPGAVVFAPAGVPHTFRVESDSARMLVLSTPAGIEQYMRALGEPAQWPWLPPPPDGPRVPAERIAAVERELGIVTHGPPPPQA
jgi:quercetin dioxygenase-like cupin family protein